MRYFRFLIPAAYEDAIGDDRRRASEERARDQSVGQCLGVDQ